MCLSILSSVSLLNLLFCLQVGMICLTEKTSICWLVLDYPLALSISTDSFYSKIALTFRFEDKLESTWAASSTTVG